jgi:transcriptional regulator GlxA family with amidase domain
VVIGRNHQGIGIAASTVLLHTDVVQRNDPGHRVVFVVYDGFQALDLTGPLDVMHAGTALGAKPGYRWQVASVDGQSMVRSETGLRIGVDTDLASLRRSRQRIDTLAVVGGLRTAEVARNRQVVDDLTAVAQRAGRTASICSGALLLAATGLLDGHQATTHWAYGDVLARRHPAIEVLADRIFVHDGDRWSSAGVTAGIDLALALVEHDHGPELAHEIAKWLVVFVRRPGGQAQFSAQLLTQPARSTPIDAVQRWLPDHLEDDLCVEALARRAGMSPRHFARAFRDETATTPAVYVERLRIEAARRLLETSDLTVEAISRRVGMRRAETLHRAFRRRLGTTPDRYRQHFGRRADPDRQMQGA